LENYCAENYIEVNTSKSKVQVFHRGRLPPCAFNLSGRAIEIVNDFVYLGFGFSTQLSFSNHARRIDAKARAKCGLLFSKLPIMDLPLTLVLDLFSIFILPIYSYGLPLWLSNVCNSSLQMIDSTLTKFLKRYLQVPLHSNNASIHFLTSTIPLSNKLKLIAPDALKSLSFPPCFNGYRLSFLQNPPPSSQAQIQQHVSEILEKVPTTLWLSRMFFSIPTNKKYRRRLFREILDSNHLQICNSTTFHPYPLPSCLCIHCGENAHSYHDRFCNPL